MFAKLRTNKYMKTKATGNDATLEFAGAVQRMARVHHYGLRDRPSKRIGEKDVQYEARPLIGASEKNMTIIQDLIISRLSAE